MNKTAAFVMASDDIVRRFAKRVENSFVHFHPDIPFYIFSFKDEIRIFGNVRIPKIRPEGHIALLSLRLLVWLKKQYDTVIRLDADTVVTAKLDEFLEGEYDIACSLNAPGENPDFKDYCNSGVNAVRSKKFAKKWEKLSYNAGFIRRNNYKYVEQDVMNYLGHSGKYNLKIVDKENCFYNETSRDHWDKIEVRNEQLFIGKRQVKVLHWAGGGQMQNKLSSPLFTPDTRNFLNHVTQTTDF